MLHTYPSNQTTNSTSQPLTKFLHIFLLTNSRTFSSARVGERSGVLGSPETSDSRLSNRGPCGREGDVGDRAEAEDIRRRPVGDGPRSNWSGRAMAGAEASMLHRGEAWEARRSEHCEGRRSEWIEQDNRIDECSEGWTVFKLKSDEIPG